ncbi:MAG: CDP-diacylglycerol--serine O-phosphatidyltransferase [Syntrophales bacterium]|nr:CDP-diacylglycerol--serine O-phosphatidyltransferase [Syntrophales bacterium]MDD5531696.1 CDP-diacylglycerol--serine O-phosphatidyltransferase [Syntrophales bacterium]
MKTRTRFISRDKFRKDRMKKGIYVLPNLFTTASLFAGFYSIVASFNEDYLKAAYAIMIALILDGLDGRMARMTNTTSKFGTEYDSLSDLISFGVAPAVLAYTWALYPFGKWGWIASFLFMTCGALRLARFNVQIGVIDKSVFNGLPIPAAAIVLASFVILYFFLGGAGDFTHISILIGMVVLALLMVSSIKYYSFKDLNYFVRKPFMSFILIVCILAVVVAEPQITIFTFTFGYAVSGPMWTLVKIVKRKGVREEESQETGHPA